MNPDHSFQNALPISYPSDERERIASLVDYQILDSEPDPLFKKVTTLASILFDLPMVAISLLDRDRQCFKASVGLEVMETRRSSSFCAHALLDTKNNLIVEDAAMDPRFADNPLVTGAPHIRFYAGAPLIGNDGMALGTFCVLDRKPRVFNERDGEMLRRFASITIDLLEFHRSNRNITSLLRLEREVYNRLLFNGSKDIDIASTFDEALRTLMSGLDPNLGWIAARMRNLKSGKTSVIHYNPKRPKDPDISEIWRRIDETPSRTITPASYTEFLSIAPLRPEYSHLVVPVWVKSRPMAVIELIYPDHRLLDPRTAEIYNLLASNLSLVAEHEITTMELKRQADMDPLTGSTGRTLILHEIGEAIKRVDPFRKATADILFYIDVDGFKEVNDNFGHETGDRLLVEIAQRLRGLFQSDDILGRMSGDEFILLSRRVAIQEDLKSLTDRVQGSIGQTFMLGDLEIKVSASIGCVILSDGKITVSDLLRRAEAAMYEVKKGHRRGVFIADDEFVLELKNRRKLEDRLREAIRNNGLFVAFQPIMDQESGKVSGTEALLRLRDDNSILTAGQFLETIERLSLFQNIDELVLAESVRILKGKGRELLEIPDFRLSVNVNPSTLSHGGYARRCLSRLREANIMPSFLMLEVIENHLIPANETLLDNLTTLRDAGVRIAVDDFGTGYSNLQHLSRLPIDLIKIDRSFLAGIASQDQRKNALLASVISIAKTLGYSIIAEGVELKEQSEHLRSLGCTCVQGYLYAEPMAIEELLEFMKRHG